MSGKPVGEDHVGPGTPSVFMVYPREGSRGGWGGATESKCFQNVP